MKKVVSFSGGRTSAYLCYLMKEMYGDDVDFVFMDTGAEHIETYRFLRRVNQCFELNVTCLRGDFSLPLGKGVGYNVVDIDDLKPDLKPFSEMMEKYGTPYIGGMFCTDRMKLRPFKKYCDNKYGKGNYETWLGIRADEPKRLTEKLGIRYMAEISDFEKQDVLDFWKDMPFDLQIDEWLGNCVFCPKKSNLKLAAAQRDEPEMYHNYLETIGNESVRMVVSRTQIFIKESNFYFYPKRFYKRSSKFIEMVEAYNIKRYEIAARIASSKMYREKKSLEQVIGMFDGSTGDEIKARIRGTRATDTGSCSESCEVFVCEAN